MGLPQVARECLGYYERDPGRLQLRFGALDHEGACDVVLEETPTHVIVRLLLCCREELFESDVPAEEREHAYLQEPSATAP